MAASSSATSGSWRTENEKLIAGYAAYTTADEYGTAAAGEAPASAETVGITIA
ncbi:LxmA leader domain family RiPP, partial [Streptomyces sp. S6]